MTQGTARKSLRDVALFHDLEDRDRTLIEQRCTWRELVPQEQIITQGDRSTEVYFVIHGRIRVMLYSAAGKAVALGEIGPGEMLGEFSAIDHAPRSATAEALQPSLVAVLKATVFEQIVTTHPVLARRLIRDLVHEIRILTARVFEFSTMAVSNRIHAELLRLARPLPGRVADALIDPVPTHAEIASRISTHREAVTRELNRLEKIGLIERRGNTLHITNFARLRRLVEGGAAS